MAKTSKGHIQQLPSGSFRVKVYAGTDPVTGKARLLRQTCPDEASAYAALSRDLAPLMTGVPRGSMSRSPRGRGRTLHRRATGRTQRQQ